MLGSVTVKVIVRRTFDMAALPCVTIPYKLSDHVVVVDYQVVQLSAAGARPPTQLADIFVVTSDHVMGMVHHRDDAVAVWLPAARLRNRSLPGWQAGCSAAGSAGGTRYCRCFSTPRPADSRSR